MRSANIRKEGQDEQQNPTTVTTNFISKLRPFKKNLLTKSK